MRKGNFILRAIAVTTLLMVTTSFAQIFEKSFKPNNWEKSILNRNTSFTNETDIRCMNLFSSIIIKRIRDVRYPSPLMPHHSIFPINVSH